MYRIAHIENDLTEKFGVPRQSGLVSNLAGRIVFEPEFRNNDALRGLEEFSHIWLIWEFSEAVRRRKDCEELTGMPGTEGSEDIGAGFCDWRPTVRPPRLGGNTRMGVFATRSPFRPNPIGLSCVKLNGIDFATPEGPVINVLGADLMNGTPIFDIKPYLPYADCIPGAAGGFTTIIEKKNLACDLSEFLANPVKSRLSEDQIHELEGILKQDPRPAYQDDPERVYTFSFAGSEVSFQVAENRVVNVKIY